MLGHMAPSECRKWAESNVTYMTATVGDVVFAPIGYTPWILGVSAENAITVFIPLLSESILQAAPQKVRSAIVTDNDNLIKDNLESSLWDESGAALRRFLNVQ